MSGPLGQGQARGRGEDTAHMARTNRRPAGPAAACAQDSPSTHVGSCGRSSAQQASVPPPPRASAELRERTLASGTAHLKARPWDEASTNLGSRGVCKVGQQTESPGRAPLSKSPVASLP